MKSKQTGFTLIEIAIVLVIIGLLLGGVLKGQELINSARVKNLATDFRNVPIFIYGYQDRFRALPGDDPNVLAHLANGTQATTPVVCNNGAAGSGPGGSCVGNGLIDGVWNSATQTDESYLVWQHVRLAGLTTGSIDRASPEYIPRNANGGVIGVQSNVGFATITQNAAGAPSTRTGTYVVCSDAILGRYVLQLDTTLDDGNPDTGSMRAIASGQPGRSVTGATVAANDGAPFTVCMGI
jgi:prepilin-type N-terminal cleavage/methylation domain-containing protein